MRTERRPAHDRHDRHRGVQQLVGGQCPGVQPEDTAEIDGQQQARRGHDEVRLNGEEREDVQGAREWATAELLQELPGFGDLRHVVLPGQHQVNDHTDTDTHGGHGKQRTRLFHIHGRTPLTLSRSHAICWQPAARSARILFPSPIDKLDKSAKVQLLSLPGRALPQSGFTVLEEAP